MWFHIKKKKGSYTHGDLKRCLPTSANAAACFHEVMGSSCTLLRGSLELHPLAMRILISTTATDQERDWVACFRKCRHQNIRALSLYFSELQSLQPVKMSASQPGIKSSTSKSTSHLHSSEKRRQRAPCHGLKGSKQGHAIGLSSQTRPKAWVM